MTRLRSEVLQLIYDESHTPVRTWLIAHMAQIESLGGMVAPIYNFFAQNRWTSAVIKGLVGFAAERHIPTLSRHSMRWYVEHTVVQPTTPKGKVYLFADEFTDRESAELGLQFAELLTGLGYEVAVPKHVESGRAAISKGCLHQAAKIATKNVTLLRDVVTEETPLVGIEPSCILSFRDEYPRLVEPSLTEDAKRLGKSCLLYDEWFAAEIEAGRITAADFGRLDAELWLHGHCHQKALVGVEKTAEVLRLIEGLKVHIIPSGCCGMAGSFGYEKRHYLDSKRIAEMVLAPTIRRARQEQPDAIVCAPGTSCRTQIKDMTGVVALHPIEVLSRVFLKKKR
jgi:Fe-S oxidoreductase